MLASRTLLASSGRILMIFALVLVVAGLAAGQGKTWTVDADFDQGYMVNLNHDVPTHDQLQLNTLTTPFPFINIACSARGTIARINTTTGLAMGEYLTSPTGMGRNPSRTTVDLEGNVWAGNRNEASGGQGSVVKVGLVIGGTRVDAMGNPDPNGDYLAPPFEYNTCVDRDGDGLIKTSRGLGDIRPWLMGQDPEDEAILLFVRTTGPNVRHVSVDANNDVWVGGYPYAPTAFDKLKGVDGTILQTVYPPCGGYGGLIDGNGVLWSAAISQSKLLRFDTVGGTFTSIQVPNSYGLGIDTNGYIWNAMWTLNSITKIDPTGLQVPGFPKPVGGGSACRGVAVTPSDNNVWVANSGNASVSRLTNDGFLIKNIPVGSTPTGLAVDSNGKVWVTNLGSNNAMRIDPDGDIDGLGAVDLTVSLGSGAGPYNYSDMTGFVAIGTTAASGTWRVVHDGLEPGMLWGKVAWNCVEPTGCQVKVEIRASDTPAGLAGETWVEVGNDVDLVGIAGQFAELRVTLSHEPGVNDTPTLEDITLTEACTPLDLPLYAGKTIDVGTVTTDATPTDLSITVATSGNWVIEELHIYVGLDPVPVNRGGNPRPGKFPYKASFSPPVTIYTQLVPLASIPAMNGTTVFCAVHAVVSEVVGGQVIRTETAWGFGPYECPGRSWDWFFDYEICTGGI